MNIQQMRILPILFFTISNLFIIHANAGTREPQYALFMFQPEVLEPTTMDFLYPIQDRAPAIGYTAARQFLDTPKYTTVFQNVGKIETTISKGSGTIIRPRTVLTAAHKIYRSDVGFVNQLRFKRNFNGGPRYVQAYTSAVSSEHTDLEVGGVRVWSNYQNLANQGSNTLQAFSQNVGLVYFNSLLFQGRHAGYGVNKPDTVTQPPSLKITMGYGMPRFEDLAILGNLPLAGWTYTAFKPLRGYGLLWVNPNLITYPGMGGGPLFQRQHNDTTWYVRGIMVTESTELPFSTYRIIDNGVYNFIKYSP